MLDKYLPITLSRQEYLSPEIRNIYKINVSLLLPSTSARLQAGGHGLIEWQSLASHHQFVTGVTYRSVTCLPATIFEHRCCYRPVDRFGIHFPMLLERILEFSKPSQSCSRTLNHIVLRVLTPIVVHAVQSIFRRYVRLLNSANFWLALSSSQ